MKNSFLYRIRQSLFMLLFFPVLLSAQTSKFTPYDELPAVEKILKPDFNENFPEWGKMMYQYPVNFNEVNTAFVKWEKSNKGVKTPILRYYKLWRRHVEPFVQYDGSIELPDVEILKENLKKAQTRELQMQRAPANAKSNNWSFLGPKETFWLNESGSADTPKPAPWQANVYSIDVTENNPNVLYAGTETGYVNKTSDKGKTWEVKGLNYPFGGGVTAIAIHPISTDTVYVAAGNSMHRSFDGGETWKRSLNGSFYGNRMKMDYNNPSKILVSSDKGVWVSTNQATTWVQKTAAETWDVEYKPNNRFDTVYALSRSGNFFRVIQSFDAGNTFSEISSFPAEIPTVAGGLLAVTPANPNVLYVIMLSRNAAGNEVPFLYKGVYANAEWTWALKYTGFTGLSSGSGLTNGQGYFDLVLEVSPKNENMIYAGTTSLYKSMNGGSNFTAVGGYQGSFSIHPDIQDMKMLSNNDTWVATDGGMNLSTDQFTSQVGYSALNFNLLGSDMWGFSQGWNEDIIVGGRYHNGNTAISDMYGEKALRMGGGESPTGWVLHGKSRHAAFDDLGDGWILPKTAEGKPEGRFIFSKHPNMDQYGGLRSNVATHPWYSGTLYLGSEDAIWLSRDFGTSFELLYEFPGRVRYLDISYSNPDVLYADIVGLGFYRSQDGGKTWRKPANRNAPPWNGQIAFAISPYNYNTVYASRQVGIWGSESSEMYITKDGGENWTQFSALSRSIKSIVIQPTTEGKDLVYAITTNVSGKAATVFYKKDGQMSWTEFGAGLPAGKRPISAAAFFRDSKLRIAGNAGVWESMLAEPDFTPIVTPFVEKAVYNCTLDTVQFDDHSMLNHENVNWSWEITPAPAYISNANIRNPKAVFDVPGKYSVTLKVSKDGVEYSKTIQDMFEVKSCPSVNDCSNPGELPKNIWRLVYADSYQVGNEPAKAFDGNPATIWHTAWGTNEPQPPHEIRIDLGKSYSVSKMTYLPRSDQSNGRIANYEVYISDDKLNWGTPVYMGTFENNSAPKTVSFDAKTGRYARLRALSEVNDNAWTSAAEISFVGCNMATGIEELLRDQQINAFPVPANAQISVTLPFNDGINPYSYTVYNAAGQQMESGLAESSLKVLRIDVSEYPSGYYFVNITDSKGHNYRAKFTRN